jgi:hypothetical protein
MRHRQLADAHAQLAKHQDEYNRDEMGRFASK